MTLSTSTNTTRPADNVVPLRPAIAPSRQPSRRAGRRTFGNVSKLPSGRWRARYPDPSHQGTDRATWLNAPTTFLTKGDAAAWLAAREAELVEYRWRPAPPPPAEPVETFASYSGRWLTARELKPSTVREYTRMLRSLVSTFGDLPLDEIAAVDIRTWYAKLDPAKKTARAHHYALLHTVLNTAVEDELIDVNPCHIRAAGVTRRARKIQPATLDELAHLIEELPDRYRVLALTAGWCALRFGELTELRRHDVELASDDSSGWLYVRRAVTWPTPHTPVVSTPKSFAGIRDVAIPPHLVPLLRAQIERYASPGPDGLVFPNTEGNHMHHGSMYKVFKRARKQIGRPDLRFHDLRHTGATMAAQAGATMRELMDRLGHSTPQAALIYQHAAADRQAALAARLSEMASSTHKQPT
jgi:integrase